GVHLYFHTSTSHNIRSRRGQGVDLKANGSYVVSSPTVIDDHAYTVTQDQEPILLTDSDLSQIQAFIDTQAILTADVGRKVQAAAFSCEIEASIENVTASQRPFITSSGL